LTKAKEMWATGIIFPVDTWNLKWSPTLSLSSWRQFLCWLFSQDILPFSLLWRSAFFDHCHEQFIPWLTSL
jgi:hypothetical protein